MIQAQWNDFIWSTGGDRVRAIQSISMETELDVERNDDKEGVPATQTVRRKLHVIDLTYRALNGLGVDPRIELDLWDQFVAHGIHAPFYLGGLDIRGREYIVTKATMETEYIDTTGRILYADFDLHFEEYAVEPSGLKVEKGLETYFRPGISYNFHDEQEAVLRIRSSVNDSKLTEMAKASQPNITWL